MSPSPSPGVLPLMAPSLVKSSSAPTVAATTTNTTMTFASSPVSTPMTVVPMGNLSHHQVHRRHHHESEVCGGGGSDDKPLPFELKIKVNIEPLSSHLEDNSCGSSSGCSQSDTCSSEPSQKSSATAGTKAAVPTVESSAVVVVDDDDDLLMKPPRQVFLSSLNPHIICNLCRGYLIDATTIVECLHSFCHSCIMKHLRTEQYCPRCEMMINTAKPNIKPDTTLQAIVYKLVPGLYEKELMRKRAFYRDRPLDAALASPEQRGEDTENLIFSPSELMSLSLEFADIENIPDGADESSVTPKYLQCPAIFTVLHLKKFVMGKFGIDVNCYNIEIMYKVKTIVLLDHFTLMDVAYIYTWKRDAPMRFFFRVLEIPARQRRAKLQKLLAATAEAIKEEIVKEEIKEEKLSPVKMEAAPKSPEPVVAVVSPKDDRKFEIVQSPIDPYEYTCEPKTETLKITLVNKNKSKSHLIYSDAITASPKSSKEQKRQAKAAAAAAAAQASLPPPPPEKDERKVENIKLKIDLSKQNSVTIINMSDPERKEIVKPIRPEKEGKSKSKRDRCEERYSCSPKLSPTSRPLTVPPLTIKAERISPTTKFSSKLSPRYVEPLVVAAATAKRELNEEERKLQFLEHVSLLPIAALQNSPDKNKKTSPPAKEPTPATLMGPPLTVPPLLLPKSTSVAKRKSKDAAKAPAEKKMKYDFKILTPDSFHKAEAKKIADPQKLTLKPPILPILAGPAAPEVFKVPTMTLKNDAKLSAAPSLPPPPHAKPAAAKKSASKVPPAPKLSADPAKNRPAAPPGSLTPHPMAASPGNRTPIAKRYQHILPKGARPNPFANITSGDVSKFLLPNAEPKIYGPVATLPTPPTKSAAANKQANQSQYLNYAIYNASKTRGNEAPPGCRTPMYAPNSPIYSPSSPSYVSNFNIPTQPTYKYTPKPAAGSSSYLQSVLNSQSSASLFPSPPTKKNTSPPLPPPTTTTPVSKSSPKAEKRAYPFAGSPPSQHEAPGEKQIKVKSLLTSCNINIPSSLSITITNEDCESKSSNAANGKHNPVNNYIEILKLPDQPSPPEKLSPPPPPPASKPAPKSISVKKDLLESRNFFTPTISIKKDLLDPRPSPSSFIGVGSNKTILSTTTTTTATIPLSTPRVSPPQVQPQRTTISPPITIKETKFGDVRMTSIEKKTPSPEKKPTSTTGGAQAAPGEKRKPSPESQKSAKSPPGATDLTKKFRPILPRTTSPPQTVLTVSTQSSLPKPMQKAPPLPLPPPTKPKKPSAAKSDAGKQAASRPATNGGSNGNISYPNFKIQYAQTKQKSTTPAAGGDRSKKANSPHPQSAPPGLPNSFQSMYYPPNYHNFSLQQKFFFEQFNRMQKQGADSLEKFIQQIRNKEVPGWPSPPPSNGMPAQPAASSTPGVSSNVSKGGGGKSSK